MPDAHAAVIADRYELAEMIGRGSMAEVWRALDRRLEVPVAVKLLDPTVSGIAAAERFAREARATAQIVHPNVVTVLDVGQDGRRRFLVMELLSGRSLADELAARGPLPVAETCALLTQAAAGLDAAHRAGVVHRDIRPANLHLTANGTLKVVDFGLAHLASEATRLTSAGAFVGNAAYLAPERIGGAGGGVAGDLYALGCVAYELLCGRPPFTGSPPDLVDQHLHRTPDPLRGHRPDIPVELERLILALLAKDPARRPADADRVARELAVFADRNRLYGRPAVPALPRPAPAGMNRAAHMTGGGLRTRDTVVLDAPPPASRPKRRPPVRAVLAVAGIAVVAASGIAVFAASGTSGALEETPASAPVAASPSTAAPAPSTPSPTPTPSATPEATPSPSATPPTPRRRPGRLGPRAWLAALDRAVAEQRRRGAIDARTADKAHRKIRQAAEKLADGKPREAQKKLRELARDLAKAYRKGEISDGPLLSFIRSGMR